MLSKITKKTSGQTWTLDPVHNAHVRRFMNQKCAQTCKRECIPKLIEIVDVRCLEVYSA